MAHWLAVPETQVQTPLLDIHVRGIHGIQIQADILGTKVWKPQPNQPTSSVNTFIQINSTVNLPTKNSSKKDWLNFNQKIDKSFKQQNFVTYSNVVEDIIYLISNWRLMGRWVVVNAAAWTDKSNTKFIFISSSSLKCLLFPLFCF